MDEEKEKKAVQSHNKCKHICKIADVFSLRAVAWRGGRWSGVEMISMECCARKSAYFLISQFLSFIPLCASSPCGGGQEERRQGNRYFTKCSNEMRGGDGYLGRVGGVVTRWWLMMIISVSGPDQPPLTLSYKYKSLISALRSTSVLRPTPRGDGALRNISPNRQCCSIMHHISRGFRGSPNNKQSTTTNFTFDLQTVAVLLAWAHSESQGVHRRRQVVIFGRAALSDSIDCTVDF